MFIGIGPGRCGTHSLAKIINNCSNTKCTHENCLLDFNRTNLNIAHRFLNALKKKENNGFICGDISLTWTFHIDAIKWIEPNIKIICMHRPKKNVVESWMRWTYGGHNVFGRPFERYVPPKYFIQWGKGRTRSPEESDRIYWEFYWDYCESIMSRIPNSYHVHLNDMNSKKYIKEIFDYLEIPESNRIYKFEKISCTK